MRKKFNFITHSLLLDINIYELEVCSYNVHRVRHAYQLVLGLDFSLCI